MSNWFQVLCCSFIVLDLYSLHLCLLNVSWYCDENVLYEFISPDFLILVVSLWVFLSLLSLLFLSFFSLSDTFKQKHISKSSERGILLFLSLRLVLLSWFSLSFSSPSPSAHVLVFPLFLDFVCIANQIYAWQECTELLFEIRCYWWLQLTFLGGKENCLNSVKCDSSFTGRHFPQNSFLFSP